MTKKRKRIGRPPGKNWSHLMLSMTPDRLAVAEQIGPTPAKGIYALLDFVRRNPAMITKVIGSRLAAGNGTSNA